MPNAWFRMYAEFADDPKVQMMSEAMQRRLTMLFCLRCLGKPIETFRETQIAFKWRITMQDLTETKALFIENGFIDENWNVLNWNKRQYISDSSTERVRQYRERMKQDETLPKQDETKTETAPEQIQSRTDTEQNQKDTLAQDDKKHYPTPLVILEVFDLPLADKSSYGVPETLFKEYVQTYPGVDVMCEFSKMRAWLMSNPTKMKTRKGMPRFMNQWLDKSQNDTSKYNGGNKNATIFNGPGNQHLGLLKKTFERRQRERLAGEIGDIPTSVEVGRDDTRIVHTVPSQPRLTSFSSSDEGSLDF